MIAIVDLGISNVVSVSNALNSLGLNNTITKGDGLHEFDRIILPGVGSFKNASMKLAAAGLRERLINEVLQGKPILGICLGAQLLVDSGEEGGWSSGLGLIKGTVKRLVFDDKHRLPHVGWNDVSVGEIDILKSVVKPCFYFVHSYCVELAEDCKHATTEYGVNFVSAFQKGHIYGTQFHPEKSRGAGMAVLKEFAGVKA
jgi:glutamine amidotransferase